MPAGAPEFIRADWGRGAPAGTETGAGANCSILLCALLAVALPARSTPSISLCCPCMFKLFLHFMTFAS